MMLLLIGRGRHLDGSEISVVYHQIVGWDHLILPAGVQFIWLVDSRDSLMQLF